MVSYSVDSTAERLVPAMKKTLPLLLALCMILSLCACGADNAAPAQSAPAETPAAEPAAYSSVASTPAEASAPAEGEPAPAANAAEAAAAKEYYYNAEKDFLIRKEVEYSPYLPSVVDLANGLRLDSVTEYSYDVFGNPSEKTTYVTGYEFGFGNVILYSDLFTPDGSEREKLTYEYDDAGELRRVSGKNQTGIGVSELENGLVMRSFTTLDPEKAGSDTLVSENLFTYDAEGRLLSREYIAYYGIFSKKLFDNPSHTLYEYDGEGRLLHWNDQSAETDYGVDVRYEYDVSGELIRMTAEWTDKGLETLEIRRDAEGRVTDSVLSSSDGTVLTHRYSYDEQGRILSDDVTGGKNELSFRLEYDESGYPVSMSRYEDGKLSKTTKYKYTTDEYDTLTMTCKPSFDEADILGGNVELSFNGELFRNGNIQWGYQYDLIVAGTNIRYLTTRVTYTYETRAVGVPVDPEIFDPIPAIADLYPDLKESYGGLKVPTPDGSEELVSVRMVSPGYSNLDILTILVYDSEKNPVGLISSFDNGNLYWYVDYEYDEQGRVIRAVNEDMDVDERYTYADDARSYTLEYPDSYGNPLEKIFHLEDWPLTEIIRKSPVEGDSRANLVYSADGLLESVIYDNNATSLYTYEYKESPDGTLSRILTYRDGIYCGDYLAFDEHGYLTTYNRLGSLLGDPAVKYTYKPVE